ncbi:transmembrane amino acid transporter protein-domain-containing protein [Aspergillus parasiticus]|uniref:Transmembrane amino acid transporter protein-domain-containing protein n=1 Tax=Aspergillus parasiticus TaxID=5067 RepID=A0A5N6DI83_ASPPA|nr:transmembrane amino acid transporter protein-domain-containing protein [Aspergillus parasiticus]
MQSLARSLKKRRILDTLFGLGVLSIPQILDSLGLIPGIICLLAVAIITTWSNYVIGTFKLRHPEVYANDDAGKLLFGRGGREVLVVAVCIYWIFCSGSGLLSTSIGLNAVSAHGTCTAVFVAVAAIASFGLASIRTLGKMKWAAWAGVASVFTAVMMATIAVGLQERPPTAPKGGGPWVSDYKLVGNPSFTQAITAVSSIVFAFAGTPGFFPIAAELRDPSYYTKSLLICQSAITSIYIAIGTVIYYSCGSYVASPALDLRFSSKYIFIRILRGSEHLTANTFKHWATWLSCTFAITVSSYLIASGIPVFSNLVALIGTLLGTFMSFQPMGGMWLYYNWKNVIVSGAFLMIAGTYGSVVNVIASSKVTSGSSAWSCADNSNS